MRRAFRMRLKPGCEAIYKEKHDQIWPALAESLVGSGITTYSIYRSGLDLFAYLETTQPLPSPEQADQVTREWWLMMEPYMEYNNDHTPKVWEIEEVFHLEASES